MDLRKLSLPFGTIYIQIDNFCSISGSRRGVNEICALWEFYAAHNGSLLPTFRDHLSVPYSRVMQYKKVT